MLSSSKVLSVEFDEKDLMKFNEKRLKSLKKACYSFVGNRFYCCECHREFMLRDEEEKDQYKTFVNNINLISKVQKQFAS